MLPLTQAPDRTDTLVANAFGFLVWWTVKQGVYNVARLHDLADQHDLPPVISGFLTGAEPKSAWLKATNLGAKGWASRPDSPHTTARYMTRDVGRLQRAIIRETIDENQKAVATDQIGLVSLDETDLCLTADIQDTPQWEQRNLVKEIVTLIDLMQTELESRIGSVDDAKVRAALLKWLHVRHRVCVRNTGGVYYLPLTPDTYDEVRDEAVAVREWVKATNLGTLSVVRLTNDGATSIDDIKESAVDEILTGVDEVNQALTQYQRKDQMNAGSMSYSTKTQLDKLGKLREKAQALEEALGDVLLRVQVNLDVAQKRAKQMHLAAAQEVTVQKKQRETQKKSGLTGTAQDRKRHVQL